MKINNTNEELKKALVDRDVVINDILTSDNDDYTDEQIEKIQIYTKLSQFEKDLLYLTSQHPVRVVADMYQVSPTHLYNKLKKIRKTLDKKV